MNRAQIIKHLLHIPLFESLNPMDLGPDGAYEDLVELVHEVEYELGDYLFVQGEAFSRLYHIVEGRVQLWRLDVQGVRRSLDTLEGGRTVGTTSLLVGDRHDATAKVAAPTRLLYLERSEFEAYLDDHPRLERRLNIDPQLRRRRALPSFDWVRDEERVVFWARRHWMNLLHRIGAPAMLFLLTSPVYVLAGPIEEDLISWILYVFLGTFHLLLITFGAWSYVNWRDDYFVLTDQRIVHSERVWPFRELFEEGSLENVEDMYVVQSGFLANAFDYGDIILQTAGERVEIDLNAVDKPSRLRKLIFRQLERRQTQEILLLREKIQEKLERRLQGESEQPDVAPEPEPTYVDRRERLSDTRFPPLFLARAFLRYFFPAAWTVSEDGSTIYWRRYWLPGLFQHGWVMGVWLTWTVAGLLLFGLWENIRDWTLVLFWLSGDAVLFGLVLWFIEDWRNDYFELTPSRIILVYQKPLLLERSRREAQLENIENITSSIPSVWARIFKYGHVMLETAGTEAGFSLEWVRHPERVSAEISRRQQELFERQQEQEAQRRQEEMLRWFDVYDTLRHRGGDYASDSTLEEVGEDKDL